MELQVERTWFQTTSARNLHFQRFGFAWEKSISNNLAKSCADGFERLRRLRTRHQYRHQGRVVGLGYSCELPRSLLQGSKTNGPDFPGEKAYFPALSDSRSADQGNDRDYHRDIIFEKVRHEFGSNRVVLVLDNAPYHSKRLDRIPTSVDKKDAMVAFLKQQKIAIDFTWSKKLLLQSVRHHTAGREEEYQTYVDDKIAHDRKFWAIELFWGWLENEVTKEQCKLVEKFIYARDIKPFQPAAAAEAGCQLGGHSDFETSATDDEEQAAHIRKNICKYCFICSYYLICKYCSFVNIIKVLCIIK
ncbi:unnamed protein product [Enterobius vermicularis]|uniref:DDE_3 domain-containing protein n=1 Tax=Enterobius vermicularis TaxID=51028 RepID=A0A0N4V4G7_ENTVE|nr:unnamed protein product [Enterobius vermicularis]